MIKYYTLPNNVIRCINIERLVEYNNMTCIGKKERQFIEDLMRFNGKTLDQKYTSNYRRVLKYRILQKRKSLTDDLLLINSILDKLQSV